jgi:hypothetical protein
MEYVSICSLNFFASEVIKLESRPPDNRIPTGTSAILTLFSTAFLRRYVERSVISCSL